MSVIQPLYFAGGRYTAGTDRKLFAALYAATSSGDRRTGVVPSNQGTQSMFVSPGANDRELIIATGLCVIPDATTQSAATPGLFLGGVDTNTETVIVPANGTASTRYDLVYAVVDETSFVITNKALTSNVATITTSAAHGFSSGQTVVISGVDDVFDGSYVIVDAGSTTFTYNRTYGSNIASTQVKPTATKGLTSAVITTKTLNTTTGLVTLVTSAAHGFSSGDVVTVRGVDPILDGTYTLTSGTNSAGFLIEYTTNRIKIADAITSVSITNSAVARARVPFSIRVQTGNSTNTDPALALTGTESGGIRLAVVATASNLTDNYINDDIKDVREFVGLSGAVQIYNGNFATPPGNTNATSGMLRYNTSTNTLEIYDSGASGWRTLYANNGSTGALSGEIFSRATHTHDSVYSALTHTHNTSPLFTNFSATSNCFSADTSVASGDGPITSTTSSSPTTIASFSYTPASGFTGNLACLITGTVTIDLSGSTTSTVTYVGVQTAGSGTDDDAFATYSSASNPTVANADTRVTIPINRVINFTSAGAHTIYLKGYKSNASNTAVVKQYFLTIIPIRAY